MKFGIIAGLVVAGNAALVLTAFTGAQGEAQQTRSGPAGLWHVELSSPPTADGTSVAVLEQEEAAFHASASAAGIRYVERRHFRDLWNGLTLSMSAHDATLVPRLAGVKAVYPVVPIKRMAGSPETEGSAQTGADLVRAAGITGDKVHVAVIDSGIDYHHPDLGGGFGKSFRVTKGYDFVGDAYTGLNRPNADKDPNDCNGHGTHVAGIIGAKGALTGVAPGVTFGAYRVFGCAGLSDDDVVLAAMERVRDDGADVVNLSLGPAGTFPDAGAGPQSPVARAADRLTKEGMVVVAPIGDRASAGLFGAASPAVGSKVIGVASFNLDPVFTVSPSARQIGYQRATGSPIAPLAGSFPIVTTVPQEACTSLGAGSLAGKVALIRRGTCTFRVKADNAFAAGAKAVVIYNDRAGAEGYTASVLTTAALSIPAVTISQTDGETLAASVGVTMTWTRQGLVNSMATGMGGFSGVISGSSSYGLAADLSVKPDIGAPGNRIRSTLPLSQGGYGDMSGSSMASAHTAGAVALLLDARRKGGRRDDVEEDDTEWARTILMNSAEPKLWSGEPERGYLESVHRQGAGMLRIDRAIAAVTMATPAKLSLGDSHHATVSRTVTITNQSKSRVTYDLTSVIGVASAPNLDAYDHETTATFSPRSVTVDKGDSKKITVTITPDPGLEDQAIYGGYIVVTPRGGGAVVRVPYAGVKN